jgi:MinD superfamily P-loop ATPase
VVLVTEPTPFGLSDLKQSVETLKILKKKFAVIINRADLGNLDTEQYLSDNNIQVLMRLPFDRKIAEIYAKGGLITEVLPEYRAMFNELTDKIFSCYETA